MIYHISKFLMRATLWVFYKRIVIENIENLPKEGPVILASNHPNSFLDAVVLGCFLPRSLHFIARSDVFNTPLKRWVLTKLQIIPIYRLQEGIENLDKNKETFQRCHEVLNENGVINIYAEGICVQEKRLRKLKKGTARIALDYVTEYKKPLPVVAVGLNYMEPMKFRKELLLGIGRPFDAAEIRPSFAENPAQAILAFNQVLTQRFLEQVVHIESREKEKDIDALILEKRRELAPLSGFYRENAGILAPLITFTKSLDVNNLPPLKKIQKRSTPMWLVWLLKVIALPGIVLNGLPWYLSYRLTASKVRLNEFKDSVLVAGAMIFSLLHMIFIVAVASAFFGWMALGVVALMAVTAAISRACYDLWTA